MYRSIEILLITIEGLASIWFNGLNGFNGFDGFNRINGFDLFNGFNGLMLILVVAKLRKGGSPIN